MGGRGSSVMRWASQFLSPVRISAYLLDALTVETDNDLFVAPLLQLESALVPDRYMTAAVFARRDVALEVGVVHRMVLGLDREPVLVRVGGEVLGHGPRDQDPSCSRRKS